MAENFKGIVYLSEELYNQKKLNNELDDNTLYGTPDEDQSIDKSIGIGVTHYDKDTLNEYLEEILSYTNPSNGGTLLFIGFKLTNDISGNRFKLTNSLSGSLSASQENVTLLSNETFITFRPTAVEPDNGTTKSVKFISSDTGNTGVMNLVLDKTGGVFKAILSGSSSTASGDTITQYFFDSIDIINEPITHLVIEYQESN